MQARDREWVITHEFAIELASGSVRKASLIARLNEVLALDSDDYTPASWAVLDSAYQNGVTVAANETATQEDVDSAASAIQFAIAALVLEIESPILLADRAYVDLGGDLYLKRASGV